MYQMCILQWFLVSRISSRCTTSYRTTTTAPQFSRVVCLHRCDLWVRGDVAERSILRR